MSKKEEKIAMIRELSEAMAPSGFEDEALEVSRRYAEGLGDMEEDQIRNLYIRR